MPIVMYKQCPLLCMRYANTFIPALALSLPF